MQGYNKPEVDPIVSAPAKAQAPKKALKDPQPPKKTREKPKKPPIKITNMAEAKQKAETEDKYKQ